MTDRSGGAARRRPALLARPQRLLPVLFLLALAAASLVGTRLGGLSAANPIPTAADDLRALLADASRPRVLVAFDADIGTYAEIRPAVRAAFAQLVRGGSTLSVVSYSAEGRALGLAELDRLRRGGMEEGRLLDLGFQAGVEAGLVRSVSSILPASAEGPLADAIRGAGGGIEAFDLVLVVGGVELGPRTWIEQVATRIPDVPIAAIVPTVLQPQAQPYRATGQLVALVAGVRDASAYVEQVRDDPAATTARPADRVTDQPPSAIPLVLGMLVTIVLLADAVASRWRIDAEETIG